jgi:hypothetical protein
MKPNPRRKGMKDPNAAALTPLNDIARQRPNKHEMPDFFRRLENEAARTAVTVYGAMLESMLEDALTANMMVLHEDRFEELFRGHNAPLGNWSSKTLLAHALGIFSDKVRLQMDQARRIRNAFAHAIRPLDFTNPTIEAECMKLDCCTMVKDGVTFESERRDARGRYSEACEMMAVHLLEYSQSVLDSVRRQERARPQTYHGKYI